jgi:hypothetical protein
VGCNVVEDEANKHSQRERHRQDSHIIAYTTDSEGGEMGLGFVRQRVFVAPFRCSPTDAGLARGDLGYVRVSVSGRCLDS